MRDNERASSLNTGTDFYAAFEADFELSLRTLPGGTGVRLCGAPWEACETGGKLSDLLILFPEASATLESFDVGVALQRPRTGPRGGGMGLVLPH